MTTVMATATMVKVTMVKVTMVKVTMVTVTMMTATVTMMTTMTATVTMMTVTMKGEVPMHFLELFSQDIFQPQRVSQVGALGHHHSRSHRNELSTSSTVSRCTSEGVYFEYALLGKEFRTPERIRVSPSQMLI